MQILYYYIVTFFYSVSIDNSTGTSVVPVAAMTLLVTNFYSILSVVRLRAATESWRLLLLTFRLHVSRINNQCS